MSLVQTTINNHQAEIARLKRELAVQNILVSTLCAWFQSLIGLPLTYSSYLLSLTPLFQAGRSAVSYEPYTATRRAELNTQIRRFIDGAIPEIPVCSALLADSTGIDV
jgi:hypothetical protein